MIFYEFWGVLNNDNLSEGCLRPQERLLLFRTTLKTNYIIQKVGLEAFHVYTMYCQFFEYSSTDTIWMIVTFGYINTDLESVTNWLYLNNITAGHYLNKFKPKLLLKL